MSSAKDVIRRQRRYLRQLNEECHSDIPGLIKERITAEVRRENKTKGKEVSHPGIEGYFNQLWLSGSVVPSADDNVP